MIENKSNSRLIPTKIASNFMSLIDSTDNNNQTKHNAGQSDSMSNAQTANWNWGRPSNKVELAEDYCDVWSKWCVTKLTEKTTLWKMWNPKKIKPTVSCWLLFCSFLRPIFPLVFFRSPFFEFEWIITVEINLLLVLWSGPILTIPEGGRETLPVTLKVPRWENWPPLSSHSKYSILNPT